MRTDCRTVCGVTGLFIITLLCACSDIHEERSGDFSNPIIPGFAPDPSIVRVGDDFYLVNSTFEVFPGIPVYHSTDLVNWELVSYALDRTSQVDLDGVASGGGIHASTIRYHDGRYFVITTNNVNGKLVNFIVTAEDPRGPWSEPYVLDDAPGIDPSLLFDDDGRAWYTGNWHPDDAASGGETEIWLQELDLSTMQLTGERHFLWRGCCGGAWVEGPHIYKRDGYYYLLVAEGGTGFEHSVTVAASKDIRGPYQSNPRNPVLSHRQLSYDYPITGVGHADLVELADGRWYAVALGWRNIDGRHGLLGRETFLVSVDWETEPYWWKDPKLTWPVFAPGAGKVELRQPMPFEGTEQRRRGAFEDSFDDADPGLEWNFRRTHDETFVDLETQPGQLRLALQSGFISTAAHYSFAGIRQRHFEFEAQTTMTFAPNGGEEAGMSLAERDGQTVLQLYRLLHGERTDIASEPWTSDTVHLRVSAYYLDYDFEYSADGQDWSVLAEDVDGTSLSPAVIRGYNYTGAYVGLYASANGEASNNFADFDVFRYVPTALDPDTWYYRQLERTRILNGKTQ